ncbi:amidase [Asaia bogorensis]|uniref:amidase n=1 Tax=Asaia bogorensis TaxID=91915 RepID=UPI000EFA8D2B|nr:amidase [Asaia bogorensis]
MTIRRPNQKEIADIAAKLGFPLTSGEVSAYGAALASTFEAYDLLDALPDYVPAPRYNRNGGYLPDAFENPYGAWHRKTVISGAATGPLHGKRVVIKDNICVAGVEMDNGSSTFAGYVPEVDATVVSRVLDAGATITGKSVCEYFCFSGGSHTSHTGPVINPRKAGFSAGGSSSGNGALLAAGEADMAIGSDQGGSVRIPASFCGVIGMKPTFGLVPYTGAMPIEQTLDHLGPMSCNVADNAALLQVIAGFDGLDPRQQANIGETDYSAGIGKSLSGLRIGILVEAFDGPGIEPVVQRAVEDATHLCEALGGRVSRISVPMHKVAPAIWLAIATEGASAQMMAGNSHGHNWRGLYMTQMMTHHAEWRNQAEKLPPTLRTTLIAAEHMDRQYHGKFYGKAQNLARRLRLAYDLALEEVDILLMPTLPIRASRLPGSNASVADNLARAFEMLGNTAPFDASGHPAISLPCASSEDLPIGLQLVGRYYDEATIYRAAYALEDALDWRSRVL